MQEDCRPSAAEPINIDDTPENADWTKQTWDLPATPEALLPWIASAGMTVEQFKTLPVYQFNVGCIRWLEQLSDEGGCESGEPDSGPIPRRLADGRLLVPRTAESTLENGTTLLADGVVEIGEHDPEFEMWSEWLDNEVGDQR